MFKRAGEVYFGMLADFTMPNALSALRQSGMHVLYF